MGVEGGAAFEDVASVYAVQRAAVRSVTRAAAEQHPELAALAEILVELPLLEWTTAEERLRAHGRALAEAGLEVARSHTLIGEVRDLVTRGLVASFAADAARLADALACLQDLAHRVEATLAAERHRAVVEHLQLRARESERTMRKESVSRVRSGFVALMSHELRTPLNSIIGFSEVLMDGKFGALNERQTRYLRNVNDSGRHLLVLVNELLDMSKIEAGRLEVLPQACSLVALVAQASALVQPAAEERQVRIITVRRGPVPAVRADVARAKQILYNLLANAIKLTPSGGQLAVHFETAPSGQHVRTSIRATEAIEPEVITRLFEPFGQLGNGRERGGTGLGLALTRQLAELMHGQVGVESRPGSGSTFFVDLPIDAKELVGEATIPERADAPLALVVDDDPAAQELLTIELREAGFRTVAVATGDEAISEARRLRPDVITLDVFLPTVDGWDVLRDLRLDPELAVVPVVMVTVSTDRQRAFSLGAVEHLVKPVSGKELLSTLARRCFSGAARERPLSVLVIDDDELQRMQVKQALEPSGFRVAAAATGAEGLAAAQAGPVDLFLVDLILPDTTGIEVVAALKADPRTRDVPILLVTAYDLSGEQRARLNSGVEKVIAKGSLRPGDLIAEVTSVLRRKR
jgi:signal transduction histidine kinase/CheY-like chemotaxis protein